MYIYIHTYIHIDDRVYMCVYLALSLSIYIYIYKYLHIYIYIYNCMHMAPRFVKGPSTAMENMPKTANQSSCVAVKRYSTKTQECHGQLM